MNFNLQDSIVLISGSREEAFGTGFVVWKHAKVCYVLTCSHVVDAVGGSTDIKINERPATVVVSGNQDGVDLAVLRFRDVQGELKSLSLKGIGKEEKSVRIEGVQPFSKDYRCITYFEGRLGKSINLVHRRTSKTVPAWVFEGEDRSNQSFIEPGCSGAPVIDQETNEVLGVVSHSKKNTGLAYAISIEALEIIWKPLTEIEAEIQTLYNALLNLDFVNQVGLFRRFVANHRVGAFLIHGQPGYGQRWLLNRLILKFVPDSTYAKVIPFSFRRIGRSSSVRAVWGELGYEAGLQRNEYSLDDIAEGIYEIWQTQSVILIFNQAEQTPKKYLDGFFMDFWKSLIQRVYRERNAKAQHQLLMFLVDEGGKTFRNSDFSISFDRQWSPDMPIKLPKITKLSSRILKAWISNSINDLPASFSLEIEKSAQDILSKSENGIPSLVLEYICDLYGFAWYEQEKKWLKY